MSELTREELIDIKNDVCLEEGWTQVGIDIFHPVIDMALRSLRQPEREGSEYVGALPASHFIVPADSSKVPDYSWLIDCINEIESRCRSDPPPQMEKGFARYLRETLSDSKAAIAELTTRLAALQSEEK